MVILFFMKILLALLYQLSKLPMMILYRFSDIIYWLMYRVVGYRKKVVYENLRNSFPNKSDEEISAISKAFYKNFADYIVETAKALTVSDHELRVRVQHLNRDLFHEAKTEGKNVVLLCGHLFNWEWLNALATIIPQENCHPVYRKMQSDFWEDEIKKIRNRFNNKALEAKEVIRQMLSAPNDGNSAYMFVADQSPYVDDVRYGLKFLNQKTPVFTGYDKLATRRDLAFIYCDVKKVKRGYYQVNYYRIYPENEQFMPMEVVRKFHKLLENTIRKRPENYLWSHRKWKYADAIKIYEE